MSQSDGGAAAHVDDRAVLDRIRAGDASAFEQVVKTYYPGLAASAYRIVRSRAMAEDVVQDVLLRMWERRAALDVHGTFIQYLFGAVRLRAAELVRRDVTASAWTARATGEQESDPPLALNLGETTLAADELRVAFERAVDALPPRCRQIFLLNREQQLSYSEIARTLGLSINTVQTQMRRALVTVQRVLGDWR
jgi:RNA polymerase sigma-70 factor (ECF subfamily)